MLGAAGVFGSRICRRLARHGEMRVIAAGRTRAALDALAAAVAQEAPDSRLVVLVLDAPRDLAHALEAMRPNLVIHTAGPFQGQDYAVAEICIRHGVHYVDIADGRDFVVNFFRLDQAARAAAVVAVSGASSVPALSAAAVDALRGEFAQLDTIEIGISPGNRAPRGPALIAAFLGYAGRPMARWEDGSWQTVHGWHDLHRRAIDGVGKRWFSACDVPDLALFPARYPGVSTVTFHAGLELGLLHLGLWLLAWLPRARLLPNLAAFTGLASALARVTLPLGSDRGGMFVTLTGTGRDGSKLARSWSLVAAAGHGPFVPATPAVLLARKLAQSAIAWRGAGPCLDLFTLDEFRAEIADLDISCVTGAA
ncbi:MAG TPA: saccharopine dehydrogenase NADP-binding domain-containing protein [Stellaceae bacterium]